jgi:glycosyltransferase involved in cell wall biosynthesis
MSKILLNICIPTYNRCEIVLRLVKHLLTLDSNNFKIVVLDNNSTDNTVDQLESINDERLIIQKSRIIISGSKNTIKALTVYGARYNLLLIDRDFVSIVMIIYLMDYLKKNSDVSAGKITFGEYSLSKVVRYNDKYNFILNVFKDNIPSHPSGWFISDETIESLFEISEDLLSFKFTDLIYPHIYLLSHTDLIQFAHIKFREPNYESILTIIEKNMSEVKSGFIRYENEITFVESKYLFSEVDKYNYLINHLTSSSITKKLLRLRIYHWVLFASTIKAKILYNNELYFKHYNSISKKIKFSDLITIYKHSFNLQLLEGTKLLKFFALIIIANNLVDNLNPITYRIPRNPIEIIRKLKIKILDNYYSTF